MAALYKVVSCLRTGTCVFPKRAIDIRKSLYSTDSGETSEGKAVEETQKPAADKAKSGFAAAYEQHTDLQQKQDQTGTAVRLGSTRNEKSFASLLRNSPLMQMGPAKDKMWMERGTRGGAGYVCVLRTSSSHLASWVGTPTQHYWKQMPFFLD
ncbi:hypothetical protein J4Q44_G00387120 [Coregonus suidteri]|uniref:Uncharacterized protein n=1 Tax=Coregonus suidteri TaxID=861788 RepID=A0AAN8KFT6_9TELE